MMIQSGCLIPILVELAISGQHVITPLSNTQEQATKRTSSTLTSTLSTLPLKPLYPYTAQNDHDLPSNPLILSPLHNNRLHHRSNMPQHYLRRPQRHLPWSSRGLRRLPSSLQFCSDVCFVCVSVMEGLGLGRAEEKETKKKIQRHGKWQGSGYSGSRIKEYRNRNWSRSTSVSTGALRWFCRRDEWGDAVEVWDVDFGGIIKENGESFECWGMIWWN